jgi:penicillin-binding protein 1A
MPKKKRRKKKKFNFKQFIFKLIFYPTLAIIILIASLYGLTIGNVFGHVPNKEELKNLRLNLATEIWSADKMLIGKVYIQNRSESDFNEYPKNLINALVATEDSRFYEHNGVDYISLLRVAIKTIILQDKRAGGGSTLTQQVAKNYFGRNNYGILTIPIIKVKEHILATRMEKVYSKNEIIELYLNTVPFGEGIYGIQSASKRFFNKNVEDLRIEESALLVGMLKANTAYNPRLHPEKSVKRRNIVLLQMFRNNYISKEKYEFLKNKKLVINYNSREKYNPAGYFIERVKSETKNLIENLRKDDGSRYNIEIDGLQIETTLNYKIQEIALKSTLTHLATQQKQFDKEWKYLRTKGSYKLLIQKEIQKTQRYKLWKANKKITNKELNRLLAKRHNSLVFDSKEYKVKTMTLQDSVEYYLKMVQAAVVAINPKTGAVLTYIGGKSSTALPYDLVYAERQMASTFKPFVYATALEQGWLPCDYIDNTQKVYADYNDWTPKNSDNKYNGHYSMKGALTHSVNVATVATYFRAGKNNVNDLVNKVGIINYNLPDYPSVALGVESSNLMKMTSAYDIFAINGKHHKPYIIETIRDKNGKILYKHKPNKEVQIITKQNQELMATMLQSVIDNGTGRSLRTIYKIKSPLGGKTGTAQNFSDAWFIGFNPNIIIGVWSGFFNPNIHFSSANGYGSRAALPIFGKTMNGIDKDKSLRKYSRMRFPFISENTKNLLDCPDYKEDNFIERNLPFIEDKNTSTSKEKKKSKKKKSFWKRIFGK